jgi:hypothetical protein
MTELNATKTYSLTLLTKPDASDSARLNAAKFIIDKASTPPPPKPEIVPTVRSAPVLRRIIGFVPKITWGGRPRPHAIPRSQVRRHFHTRLGSFRENSKGVD